MAPRLRLGTRVVGIARTGLGKVRTRGREGAAFEIRTLDGEGNEARLFARAVIDASGTWTTPNAAGARGLPAIGERAAVDRLRHGLSRTGVGSGQGVAVRVDLGGARNIKKQKKQRQ